MTCAEMVRDAADLQSDGTGLQLGCLDAADNLDWTWSLPDIVPCQAVDHPFAAVYCTVPSRPALPRMKVLGGVAARNSPDLDACGFETAMTGFAA